MSEKSKYNYDCVALGNCYRNRLQFALASLRARWFFDTKSKMSIRLATVKKDDRNKTNN